MKRTFCLSLMFSLSAGCGGEPRTVSHSSTERRPSSTVQSSAPTARELSLRAVEAVAARGIGYRVSPALPHDWPPQSAELEWLAYEVEPLPTGVESFAVKGPAYQVRIGVRGGDATVSTLADGKPLGTDHGTDSIAPDEQALALVVAGTRSAESARTELLSYLAWASRAGGLGDDVRRRHAAFFAWLMAAQ